MNLSSYYRRALFFFLFFFSLLLLLRFARLGHYLGAWLINGWITLLFIRLARLFEGFPRVDEGWQGLARIGTDLQGLMQVSNRFLRVFKGFWEVPSGFSGGGGWGFARVDGGFQQVFRGSKGFQDLSKGWWRLFRSLSGLMRVSKGF